MGSGAKWKVIVFIVAIVAGGALLRTIYLRYRAHETFVAESEPAKFAGSDSDSDTENAAPAQAQAQAPAQAPASASASAPAPDPEKPSMYDARMHVMKTFESLLKRRPSSTELRRYASMLDFDRITNSITEDFKTSPSPAINAAEIRSSGTISCPKIEVKRRKKRGSKSDSSSDSDSEDCAGASPKPVSASVKRFHEFRCGKETTSRSSRSSRSVEEVCLNKHDVIKRLDDILKDVREFKRMVEMM
jgi:hypothetical protein